MNPFTGFKSSWNNPANHRYYSAKIYQDLLGDWIVWLCWGKQGSKLGRTKVVYCETPEKAKAYLKKLDKIRTRHGYQKIENLKR